MIVVGQNTIETKLLMYEPDSLIVKLIIFNRVSIGVYEIIYFEIRNLQ